MSDIKIMKSMTIEDAMEIANAARDFSLDVNFQSEQLENLAYGFKVIGMDSTSDKISSVAGDLQGSLFAMKQRILKKLSEYGIELGE